MATIFDIETDGLLDVCTKIHCIALKEVGKKTISYTDHIYPSKKGNIADGLERLSRADLLIGHNIQGFDIPAIQKLYPEWEHGRYRDTLIMSRLQRGHEMMKHGLAAWGTKLKFAKGDFGQDTDWKHWSPSMHRYCIQDVDLNEKVWVELIKDNFPEESIELEHEFAKVLDWQMKMGVPFDEGKARELLTEVEQDFLRLQDELSAEHSFKNHTIFIPKRDNMIKGYKAGVPFTKTKTVPFNPGSRTQVVRFFKEKYRWNPTEFTDKKNPKVSGEILRALPYTEAENFADYFDAKKLLGQLDKGKVAWLKCLDQGRIHGYINHNGAITGRCTHCVPLTSEALTRRGWKRWDELILGEEILAYDLKSETKKWTPLKKVHKYKDAIVGSFGNRSMRVRCTKKHKVVIKKRSRTGREDPYASPLLVNADSIARHDAVVINAAMEYSDSHVYSMPPNKYETEHLTDVCRMNESTLSAFVSGFLLADGYYKKPVGIGRTKGTWSVAQAQGYLNDTIRTGMYIVNSTRLTHTCKNSTNINPAHRRSFNTSVCSRGYVRAKEGFSWKQETVEDVWCPETKLGTWVMRQEDGLITITGNSGPNLAQVPSVGGFKGAECRSLFIAPEGHKMVGCDAAGLELRNLAHFMAYYDHGKYAGIVLNGDIHTENQNAAGLATRPLAKKFIYAHNYGAGDALLGAIIKPDANIIEQKILGRQARLLFMTKIPALSLLINEVKRSANTKGYLVGLDGRRLQVHSDHVALNVLLQGAGAVVMKKWWVEVWKKAQAEKVRAYPVLHVHDEGEAICEDKDGQPRWLADTMETTLTEVGEHYKFRCRLDGEAKIGVNWLEVH